MGAISSHWQKLFLFGLAPNLLQSQVLAACTPGGVTVVLT